MPGIPEQYIRQHNLLLFLDGLNEMPLDSRSERVKVLRTFLEQNPEVQAVVCCRVRDYEDDEALNLSLPVVRVLPLDDGRVQDFIARNGGASSLWDTIRIDDALRALAANPYNLYQLIKVSTEQGGQDLPRDLNQLYKRYLKVTFDRYTVDRVNQRDKETPLLKLTMPKLEKRLQRLAFAMLAEGKGTSADLEWALRWRRRWRWGQQAIKDGINLGVLIGDGSNLRFYHQSLHGYFAIEPLGNALTVGGGLDRFTKNPFALIAQIGDLGIAGVPAIEPLIKALRGNNSDIRNQATAGLAKIGVPAVKPLITVLGDSDEDIRISAAAALGQIGVPAVEPLIAVLGDRDEDIRINAAAALGLIGDKRAVEPLIKTLNDHSASVRYIAAEALGEIQDERAINPLIRLLGDGDANVRSHAAETLGKLGDARAVEPLIKALGDSYQEVRERAAEALGNIGDARAVVPLIRALRDWDMEVRRGAAEALGNIGAPAIEPLIWVLSHGEWHVRGSAAEALGDWDMEVRRGAAEALGKIGDARAVEPLIKTLGDSDWRVRISAAVALEKIGDAWAVEPLVKALGDSNVIVRDRAAAALEKIGTPEAVAAVATWRTEQRG